MKGRTRKVLKLCVSTRDPERLVRSHKVLQTSTLSAALTKLIDAWEGHRFENIVNEKDLP